MLPVAKVVSFETPVALAAVYIGASGVFKTVYVSSPMVMYMVILEVMVVVKSVSVVLKYSPQTLLM